MKRSLLVAIFACMAGSCGKSSVQIGARANSESGVSFKGCNANNPKNASLDSDCDGLSDEEEFKSFTVSGKQTEPCKADSDGDGILDGVEKGRTVSVDASCAFVGDADPSTETNPTEADTDGDGLPDGSEDKNQNGKVDEAEASPLAIDSDCDGIADTVEVAGTLGCSTDPTVADSDGDGLTDGLEQGVTASPGAGCQYPEETFDVEPQSKTQACASDSDGDGLPDGSEDFNLNGRIDQGEFDPNYAQAGTQTAVLACAKDNFKPITFQKNAYADAQQALVPSYQEVSTLKDNLGKEVGLAFFDSTHQIGGVVLSAVPTTTDASAEETVLRARMSTLGPLSGSVVQNFTTWDGYTSSLRANYRQEASSDLKSHLNSMAQALAATPLTGMLSGASATTGPFRIQMELVRRSNKRLMIVLAITHESDATGQKQILRDDVAGGSALAQFADTTGVMCELFEPPYNPKVDFVWVVDNSGSMQNYQNAVAQVGHLFSDKLGNAGIDWRVAGISTDGKDSTVFVNSIDTTFFTKFGTNGSGSEKSLFWAQAKVQSMLPRTAGSDAHIRPDAALHLILLGDADDQSADSPAVYTSFFQNYDGSGAAAVVHGIVCPEGQLCEETQMNPRSNLTVIRNTGGINGDINAAAQPNDPATASTLDAILNVAIAGTGHTLMKAPISSTIKVSMEPDSTLGPCNTVDVPRDRSNGFDFDAATRKLFFFGNCRPNAPGKHVAVSYRYWIEKSPNPDGDACNNQCSELMQCAGDPGQCVCLPDCGGCPSSLTCDAATCVCKSSMN